MTGCTEDTSCPYQLWVWTRDRAVNRMYKVSAFVAAFSWWVVGSKHTRQGSQSLWVGDGHHKCSELEQQEISSALCDVAEGKESCAGVGG